MPEQDIPKLRRRLMRVGAIAGVVLALVCNSLPPKYHHACNVVTQIAGLTCGGGSHP